MINKKVEHRVLDFGFQTANIEHYKKYREIKSMQSFRQKFSEMIREYKDGFKLNNQTKLNCSSFNKTNTK